MPHPLLAAACDEGPSPRGVQPSRGACRSDDSDDVSNTLYVTRKPLVRTQALNCSEGASVRVETAPKVQRLRGRDPAIEAPPFVGDGDLLLACSDSCLDSADSEEELGMLSHDSPDERAPVMQHRKCKVPVRWPVSFCHLRSDRNEASVRLKPFSTKQMLSFFGR